MARNNQNSRSGRGRGRFRGRGGRGNNFRSNRKTYQSNSGKKELKFYPHSAGKQQSVTYSAVRDEIVNVIQRTYTYGSKMVKSIRDETPVDVTSTKPTLDTSSESNASIKAKEDKQFELEFNIKMEQWIKMKDIVKENEMKAAALIWKYCSTQIQVRV